MVNISKTPQAEQSPAEEPWVQVVGSRHLATWLAEQHLSLAFTTYQAGKLFFIGHRIDGQLSVFERTFNRCMGLWASADAGTLWMSTKFQLWRLENLLARGNLHHGYDALYVPQAAHTTGDLDIHDVAVETGGRVVFVNTLFGCLATIHDRASFSPLWRPPFIDALVPQDRCHLNGLALRGGKVRYATMVSRSNVKDGWRDSRRNGGGVIDVYDNQFVVDGLSMPHSPRWYREKLWVLNSGTGEFGTVDLDRGKFEPIVFCPGYLRGMAFVGDFALVTASKPRGDLSFGDLPFAERLQDLGAEPRCGLQVIDLRSGDCVHWLHLEGGVTELYDVAALPGLMRPMALGLKTDDIDRLLSVGPAGQLRS
jgi:uncharacterized protein (TIGR03032 family)